VKRRLIKVNDSAIKDGTFIIPDSVTNIGDMAFHDCTSLANITIHNLVTYIGNWAFYGCTNLSSITIPGSVTQISDFSFLGCTSLTIITIPNSVTYVGEWAFKGCTSLSQIIIASDDDNEIARVTALLPDELQSKVIKKQSYDMTQNIHKAPLIRITNEPKTTKASIVIWFNRLLPSLPLEMISEIGAHCDNKYVDEAKQEMQGLKIPTDNNWCEYTVKVNSIADKHIAEAKTNYPKTVGFFCKRNDEPAAVQSAPLQSQ